MKKKLTALLFALIFSVILIGCSSKTETTPTKPDTTTTPAESSHASMPGPSDNKLNDYVFYTNEGINYLNKYVGNDTSLELPDNYKGESYVINEYAFSNCKNLISVKISDGVTAIGKMAFDNCSNLITILIGKNVTSIGDHAFVACYKLVEVINKSSLNIERGTNDYGCVAFYALNVKSEGPSEVATINDYIFYANEGINYLIAYKGNDTSLELPDSYNGEPYVINEHAFSNCKNLISVEIPTSVTSIGEYAFRDCRGLTSIIIPTSLTSIGDSTFKGCSSLTSFTIPSSVTSIGNSAFEGCSGLSSITIPNSVISIGYYAFSNCSNLITVFIGKNVTSIEDYAFVACYKLVEVINKSSLNIEKGTMAYGEVALYALNVKSEGPSEVTTINDYVFYINEGINYLIAYKGNDTSLILPDSYNGETYVIRQSTFNGCDNLISVEISNSVTSIGYHAFYGCYKLVEVINKSSLNIEKGTYDYGEVALYALNVKSEGPSEVATINDYVFYINEGINYLIAYKGNDTSLILPDNYKGESYVINEYAFSNYKNLISAEIPNGVTSIEDFAFSGCSGLTSVTIPNSVTSIGNSAFSGCSGLASVTIPNGVTNIGDSTFEGCSGLTSVTIPNGVTSIGDSTFKGCSGLTSVTIPNSVTSIGNSAFSGCSLVSVTLDNCEKSITASFYNCSSIIIGDKVKKIEDRAFYNFENLVSVIIGNSVISIGSYAFYYCSGLTSVTIPNSVTSIGSYAFYKCSNLITVLIGKNVTSIGRCAFLGCSKLVEVINKSSLNIERGTKDYGGIAINALNVKSEGPSEVSTINDYVFYTNEGINYLIAYKGNDTALELPDNYNGESYVINEYAFSNCENLISVEIPNSVTSIGDSAFRGCTGLTSIIIPTSVTSIERSTFISCSKLNSYYLGNRDEWYEIRNYYCLDSVTSFYSSTQPTDTEYNYWHYDENGNPVTW